MRYTWWYDMIWYGMVWYDMIWYGDPTNTLCVVTTFYGDTCYTYFVVFLGNVASYFFSGIGMGSIVDPNQAPCWYFDRLHDNQWYTGWWFHSFFYFPWYMGYIILPIDELIFFKMVIAPTTQMIYLVEVFAISRTNTIKGAGINGQWKGPQDANSNPNLGDHFVGRNMWIQLLFAYLMGLVVEAIGSLSFFRIEFLFSHYSWY